MKPYIDLHTHTLLSDGVLTSREVVAKAYGEGIRHIALTDHNRIHTDMEQLRALYTDMEIISASEISAAWLSPSGENKEIHIVGLYLEQTDVLKEFLQTNCDNGIGRLENMLVALAKCGVVFNGYLTYQDFKSRYYPERTFIGRPQLAEIAIREGYASTVDQFLDEYIGDYGHKRAYVPSSHAFATVSEVISVIHKADGVAILAHPMSYKLSEPEIHYLIDQFVSSGGDGMECLFSRYSSEKCAFLVQIANENDLLISCASDFHGNRGPNESMGHYPAKYLDALRKRHDYYVMRNEG